MRWDEDEMVWNGMELPWTGWHEDGTVHDEGGMLTTLLTSDRQSPVHSTW